MSRESGVPGATCLLEWTALDFLQTFYSSSSLRYTADVIASSCLFGVVSTLAAISALLLVNKGVAQSSVRILLAAIVALYISTCVYFGYIQTLYWTMNNTAAYAASTVLNLDNSLHHDIVRLDKIEIAQMGATAATLTVNMLISDMIVWWRALAIWPGNRLVWRIGVVLIVTTGVLGIVTTYQNFPQGYSTVPPNGSDSNGFHTPKTMAYDPIGVACAVLSLATNVIATALIGYKAWIHRRIMQEYQVIGKMAQTRAVRVMMFIVESGVGYCLLWIIVVSYVGITLKPLDTLTITDSKYIFFMENFVFGSLVPLIAIYPMAIIVIVTVNQSPIDHLCTSLSLQSY